MSSMRGRSSGEMAGVREVGGSVEREEGDQRVFGLVKRRMEEKAPRRFGCMMLRLQRNDEYLKGCLAQQSEKPLSHTGVRYV